MPPVPPVADRNSTLVVATLNVDNRILQTYTSDGVVNIEGLRNPTIECTIGSDGDCTLEFNLSTSPCAIDADVPGTDVRVSILASPEYRGPRTLTYANVYAEQAARSYVADLLLNMSRNDEIEQITARVLFRGDRKRAYILTAACADKERRLSEADRCLVYLVDKPPELLTATLGIGGSVTIGALVASVLIATSQRIRARQKKQPRRSKALKN
jgi:hypothetical protein